MIIRLQHQRSDGEKDIYHLKSGRRYHIGRGSACEVRILDLKLSRKHCAVEYSEGEWRMIDLASTNGCKVDGDQIVGSVPLKVGSQIDIGQSTLQVVRILGDDEGADEDALSSTVATMSPPQAKAPAAAPAPASAPAQPRVATRPSPPPRPVAPIKTPVPLEQERMDDESAPVHEHVESEWEPEPEPESLTKTGALVPNPQEAAAAAALAKSADAGLAASRAAANAAALEMSDNTGQIQRPGARMTSDQPPQPELESGGYRSLDQIELADDSAVARKQPGSSPAGMPPAGALAGAAPDLPIAPPPPRPQTGATRQQPGTETRTRQKMVPVIVQALDADGQPAASLGVDAPAGAPPARPEPAADPSVAAAPADIAARSPEQPPAAPVAAAEAERTFFITVLGRRVGPLTRAIARDLKAREIKGTLTFKDLERYS